MDAVELKRLEQEAVMREVYDLRVFVIGGGFQYIKMFHDAGFRGSRNVEDADILCFTGGEDVSPGMYGEKPLPGVHFNPKRDAYESGLYADAMLKQIPMIGICRGGQFLNVMNKGKMWQDVNNHGILGTHSVTDLRTGEEVDGMTSTHHQMMIPGDSAEVIALACRSTRKESEGQKVMRAEPVLDDTEVVWYPDSLSLCFQPHPEFSHGPCRNYFLDLVDSYILPAC